MEDGEGGVILALAEVESEVPNGGRDGAVGLEVAARGGSGGGCELGRC